MVTETAADPVLSVLASTIKQGFPTKFCELVGELSPYWNIRKSLDVEDDVVWYNGRILVPASLRSRALGVLHSTHQGITGMEDRAREIVYWPGITNDIAHTRNSCRDCCRNAPQQATLPVTAPEVPSTPFEAIFADFFEESGYHYLLWLHSQKAGSASLIAHLRTLFTTFGIPLNL